MHEKNIGYIYATKYKELSLGGRVRGRLFIFSFICFWVCVCVCVPTKHVLLLYLRFKCLQKESLDERSETHRRCH